MSKKILIVDDEPGIRESLREYFEIQDFSTEVAECGEQALEILKFDTFDMILSDVRMPRGDGKFLLRSIKSQNVFSPIVFLMSGFTDMSIEEAYNEGAAALFTKPFNPQDILKSIERFKFPREQRWSEKKSQSIQKQMNIQADSIADGVLKNIMTVGHLGFFVPSASDIPKPGEHLKLNFKNPQLECEGVVRWTREQSQKAPKGIGFEINYASSELIKQFQDYLAKEKPVASIPFG